MNPAAKKPERAESANETVVIPVVTLMEVPRLSEANRRALVASLEESEARMAAGAFVTYSPEWLRQRFEVIYAGATREK